MLSAEELAQRAMDNAANAMAAGRKILTKDEALGQEASSALMQGGTISDKVNRWEGLVGLGCSESSESKAVPSSARSQRHDKWRAC